MLREARSIDWLLLIYTLPSQPSRKRAYVWRELKRLGALYLRDGVAILPTKPELRERLEAIVVRVEEYEGTADLAVTRFTTDRDAALIERFREERLAEYRELHHACVRFLRDVLHEVDSEDFGFPDVENLEGELARLHRWHEQIAARDYFGAPGRERVLDILDKCDRAFEHFSSEAATEERAAKPTEDVFERLSGAAEPVSEDYPM
jgi:hypothetical protein